MRPRLNLVVSRPLLITIAFVCFIIIVIVAIATWREVQVYRLEHAEQRQAVTQNEAETANEYLRICRQNRGSGFLALLDCAINSFDANRNSQRAKYDLEAQQDMAEWAFALLLVSIPGVAISIAGLVVLFWSLAQTRITIRDNREIGEAQLGLTSAWSKATLDSCRTMERITATILSFVWSLEIPETRLPALSDGP